jgi:sulfide:quinone oxidoreductase
MATTDPIRTPARVVIAGGGVAALEAMIALRATAAGDVDVTVVSAADVFTYRPLLVGEPFGVGHPARFRLDALCRDHGAGFVHAAVERIDAPGHRVALAGGGELAYDVLIAAVGARAVPAFEYGVTFDRETSPQDFADVLADLRDGLAPRIAIVVPDTVSWTLPAYELALMTAAWGRAEHPEGVAVQVVTHEGRPLEAFGPTASDEVERILDRERVSCRSGVHADMLSFNALRAGGAWIDVDRVVSLPHISGPRLPGLPADPHGFLPVDHFARVTGVDDVYAAGDGTTVPVKQGGLAAQMADAAARHIVARLRGAEEPEPFRPVLRGLLRTRGGPRYLRAELDDVAGTSTVSKQPLWWPPSKISSRWLAPYLARVESARARGERLADPSAGPSVVGRSA